MGAYLKLYINYFATVGPDFFCKRVQIVGVASDEGDVVSCFGKDTTVSYIISKGNLVAREIYLRSCSTSPLELNSKLRNHIWISSQQEDMHTFSIADTSYYEDWVSRHFLEIKMLLPVAGIVSN